ncbi:MAG: SDR family NAD(P)-dependent oxidoreductase [Deinococcota bacterium]
MPASKTVLITGGTSGLGYETAKTLVKQGWHVVITSRDPARGQQATTRLNEQTNSSNVIAKALNLGSQSSIHEVARELKTSLDQPLHAIVCNAGVSLAGITQYTEDGIEKTFGVNHLGHFLLVNLLLESLSKPARIIFVSSGTHIPDHTLARRLGTPAPIYTNAQELAYPNDKQGGRQVQSLRYTTSKLCNVLCANELARRLKQCGISTSKTPVDVYSIDPGLMPGTGLSREYPTALRFVFGMIASVFRPFVAGIRTPAQSGQDVARLITDSTLAGLPEGYYDGQHAVPASPLAYDLSKAQDLWETSTKLVRLTPQQSPLVEG